MISYLELAFAWLLFLSIPALASGMFYRAWKMSKAHKLQSLPGRAVSRQASIPRWSLHAAINLACGLGLCAVFAAIVVKGVAFATWSGSTALIVWIYCIAMYVLKRESSGKNRTA